MKSIKAPRTSVSRTATSVPTLLLLCALSGTALAATDFQQPCPEAEAEARQHALKALIADEAERPLVRTVEAAEAASSLQAADSDEEQTLEAEAVDNAPAAELSAPAYTTRLPGVSANDMPGFRRHMYRTDI